MRFMIIVKATVDTEAGKRADDELFHDMAAYHEEMDKAGVLLGGSGLQPSAKGWRIKYDGNKRVLVDGPFTETKELIAGYTIIQTRSREEAVEWSKRFPNPMGRGERCEIEVRQLYELEDLGGPSTVIERFRDIGIG